MTALTPQARVQARVSVTADGCWEATGYRDPYGYGRISVNQRVHLLHRFSYEAFIGPIPEGMDIDHLCRNRACSNPEHLEPVTRRENLARGVNWLREKTHCKLGHPLERLGPQRGCRTCRREANRRYEEKRRASA